MIERCHACSQLGTQGQFEAWFKEVTTEVSWGLRHFEALYKNVRHEINWGLGQFEEWFKDVTPEVSWV